MKGRERYWSRVQDALDARCDPFGDDEVRAWLAEHPGDLDELTRLRARLARVAGAGRVPRRMRRGVLLAAAAVAGVLGAAFFAPRRGSPAMTEARVVQAAIPARPATCVNEIHLVLRTTRGGVRTTTTWSDGELAHRRELIATEPWTRITTSNREARP